jgi:hypothetical protein
LVSIYSALYQGICTANTDNYVIEVAAPASNIVRIRSIRIMHGDGTATASSDYYRKVKVVTQSATGTGGATFTPVATNANAGASGATVKTGLTTGGTLDTTIDTMSQHNTTDFLWEARDEEDKIVVKPGASIAIIVNPAA